MTFSLHYKREENTGNIYAADWGWKTKGRWTTSENDGSGWFGNSEIGERAYQGILKHFGLPEKSFPIDKVRVMGPDELIQERRALEKAEGLVPLVIDNHTLGATRRSVA